MSLIKLWLAFFLTIFFSIKSSYGSGAYIVDDGGIAQKDKLQVENWYSHSNSGEQILVTNPAYQLLPNAEFSIQETYDERSPQLNTLWPQVKYLWHDQKDVLSSAVLGVNYATNNNAGIYGSFFYIPTSIALNEFFNLTIDVGIQRWKGVATSNTSFLIGGIGAEIKVSKKMLIIPEIFRNGKNQNLQFGNQLSIHRANGLQLGLRYFALESLILDAIYGKGIVATQGEWATIGVTVLF